ncbi:MAG: TonB dependent receptor [Mucilaginibacter sp.]|nr:TonB dependent receptor [Mucilaginibacter sp.]
MLLMATVSYAQKETPAAIGSVRPGYISGTMLDEFSRPQQGVFVSIKGDTTHVVSNAIGFFEIKAVTGAVLVFKFKDHEVREVVSNTSNNFTVKLEQDHLIFPDKVQVLYGVANRSNMLGSIATVYTDQLTTTPASLDVYALPGQLSGLYTQQSSGFTAFNTTSLTVSGGIPGNTIAGSTRNAVSTDNTEFAVTVRGQTPITVIDGVQREISSIDPESIESISVLKDGLSTILLGVNSSRPVILITTKRGKEGPPKITFTAEEGIQKSLSIPTPLSAYEYAYLINETLTSDGKLPQYSAADFTAYRNHSDPYGHPDINWFNTILNNEAPQTAYKLNINGGTNVAKYTVSLGYYDQTGIFKTANEIPYNTNNDLTRYTINSDIAVQVNKNLNVDLQLFGRVQTTNQPGATNNNGSLGYNYVLSSLFNTPSNAYTPINRNGSFGGSNIGGNTGTFSNNLLAMTEYSGYVQNNANDILANLDLTYNLNSVTKGLTAKMKGNLSYQSVSTLNRGIQNNSYLYNKDSTYSVIGGQSAQTNVFSQVYTSRQSFGQASLNYDRQFGKHSISAVALYDIKEFNSNYDLTENTTNIALRVGYNYNGKYLAEAAVNRSGNNYYPPGLQFGTFYAGGLGWQMGKEDFIKDNVEWISSWKWRGTYGRTGNANITSNSSLYFAYNQTYASGNAAAGKFLNIGTGYSPAYYGYDNSLANPYITWESADKIDFGTDISMFKDHFMVTADYYHDRYFNVLGIRGNTIALLGAQYPIENIGINLYQGVELSLTYKGNVGNFNYFVTGNGNLQASKIIYNDELTPQYPWNKRTGLPVSGTFYGYTSLGFYQTAQDAATSAHIVGYTPQPGDIKYKDLNGDGVINQYDQSTIGGTKPLIFYGLNFGFSYKGFSFSAIIQGVTNRQISVENNVIDNFGLDFSTNNGQAYLSSTGRWTPETASTATLPRLAVSTAGSNAQFSSFWLKSGDYVRLKNAEIGYSLPYNATRHLKLAGIRFFVNGENLVTLAGFKGMDPEVTPGSYPIQRVLNAGLTIKL